MCKTNGHARSGTVGQAEAADDAAPPRRPATPSPRLTRTGCCQITVGQFFCDSLQKAAWTSLVAGYARYGLTKNSPTSFASHELRKQAIPQERSMVSRSE